MSEPMIRKPYKQTSNGYAVDSGDRTVKIVDTTVSGNVVHCETGKTRSWLEEEAMGKALSSIKRTKVTW